MVCTVWYGCVLAGVTSVIFALWREIATIAAVESAEPTRTIARMTATVALRILLFYVVSIALIVAIVRGPDIKPGYSPFYGAEHGFPSAPRRSPDVVVLIAVLSCLNSGLYVTAQGVLFTLAGARRRAVRS